jgi:hypothetical protein
MRRSRRELKARWLARGGVPATVDQPLRDDPPELNLEKRRGPPPGNQNRRIHGGYSRERKAFFAELRAFVAEGRELLKMMSALTDPDRRSSTGSTRKQK